MPFALGDRYGASTSRDFSTSVRTGSFDQNTSACGLRLLRQKTVRQPGRLGLLRVVDRVDLHARLLLVFPQNRLGEDAIRRHIDGHRPASVLLWPDERQPTSATSASVRRASTEERDRGVSMATTWSRLSGRRIASRSRPSSRLRPCRLSRMSRPRRRTAWNRSSTPRTDAHWRRPATCSIGLTARRSSCHRSGLRL